MAETDRQGLPRLVILGSGFGGYSLLRRLRKGRFDVTIVSPRNYFLFTPLLPSAVTGTVEFRSILEPLRRQRPEARHLEARAAAVDWEARTVRCASSVSDESFDVGFDRLVLAVGAGVATYGIPGVKRYCTPLRTVEDGRRLRAAITRQFAAAEAPDLPRPEVERRVRFVVIGGGPTGVEVAAEIQDFVGRELARAYPRVAGLARVVMVEASDRLLGSFDQALSAYTRRHFLREGIEVRTASAVKRVEEHEVFFADDRTLGFGLAVWAGGNEPVPLVRELGLATHRDGRLQVDGHLRVPDRDGVYALGDCAADRDHPLPATAQVAQQQGKYLGRLLSKASSNGPPFSYRSLGMLAYIGAGKALADLPGVPWSGRSAWLFWRSVYLTRLVSWPDKVKVAFDWIKARLFGRDLSRF